MIAEGLKTLAELVRAGLKTEVLQQTPREMVVNIGGNIERVAFPVSPRSHQVFSLGALVAYANAAAEEDAGRVIVWFGGDRVTAVLNDDGHRDERVKLVLETSGPWDLLWRLDAEGTWMDLRSFTRMLRVDLAGCIAPADLLEPVRKIRFENGVTVNAESTRNRESLGREIVSQASAAAGAIPEVVTLGVPVWATPGCRWSFSLRCAVETDPAAGRLQLLPLPGEMERVRGLADAELASALEELDKSIPRYHGTP
jgi:hypothetical protein